MKKSDLNSKWKNIFSARNKKGYKVLRISSKCRPDLFLAIDGDGYRCLLLYLTKDVDVSIKRNNKDKLLLSYLPDKRILLIKLKDFEFIDLFDDLILSIFSKINFIHDIKIASEKFTTTFYKWSLFFEDSHVDKLSEEQIQGLFGELFVLSDFLKDSTPSTVNSILNSWKGLYDSKNDFEFEFKNVEVKTKKESKLFVKISSEHQLDKEDDKDLELMIVSIRIDLLNGRSIHDITLEIIESIRKNLGDLLILYQALNQKKLTITNLKQYDNHRYIVVKTELFDAANDDFPKLSISNIHNEISNLKYQLRVNRLDDFLKEQIKY